MDPGRRHRRRHGGVAAADGDFASIGFALVLSAVSCLLFAIVGNNDPDGMEWEVIPAFGMMAAGLLLIMHGMRDRGRARPPAFVRGVANAALLHPVRPGSLMAGVILLLLPFLEAWFDFF